MFGFIFSDFSKQKVIRWRNELKRSYFVWHVHQQSFCYSPWQWGFTEISRQLLFTRPIDLYIHLSSLIPDTELVCRMFIYSPLISFYVREGSKYDLMVACCHNLVNLLVPFSCSVFRRDLSIHPTCLNRTGASLNWGVYAVVWTNFLSLAAWKISWKWH